MTGRENLLRLLRGEKPAWTPCSINLWQWFTHQKKFDSLPEELRGVSDHVEAMKVLGCDVFVRMPGGVGGRTEGFDVRWEKSAGSLGPRSTMTVPTPHGDLRAVSEEQTAMTSQYNVEDLVKDWRRDRAAYLWALERTHFHWNRSVFEKSEARTGEWGVPLCSLPPSPLKKMHWDFGLDHTCVFVMDEPRDAKLIADLYWERVMPALREMATDPRVHAVCVEDNVDTPFYPPGIIDRYWVPYLRQLSDLMHAQGKRVFVHACGHLRQLKRAFVEAGIDGLDGMPHAPLGDWSIADAREMPRPFIYDGGFSAHEQVTMSDSDVDRFYEAFFGSIRGHDRFVFAAACQTAITTDWRRIQRVVRLCRAYGGEPLRSGDRAAGSSRAG